MTLSMGKTATAWMMVALFGTAPLLGCTSGGDRSAPPPAVDDSRGAASRATGGSGMPAPQRSHMSTGKKAVILAGAAALYYMYKKHQHASTAAGAEGQYYLSKNGRVYYRDAQHRAHWVTPPAGGIEVPADEGQQYEGFQGYQNRPTGRDLSGLGDAAD